MTRKNFRFSFHVLTHPLDGFWDLKYENRGSLSIAFLYMALWFITNVYLKTGLSFLFNPQYNVKLDVIMELRQVLLVFFLFCVANWSVTTLMDGKGFFKDIVMVFGYACLPMTLVRVPAILFSNIASMDESVYLSFFLNFAWVWFIFLLFVGVMQIHDYSLSKAFATSVLTICSMLILVFIIMVFFNIFSQMLEFTMMMLKELRQRF
jgi:hypothetical protein